MVMTHTQAKGQGQRSFGSKVTVETGPWTDGQTDGRRRLHYPRANEVGNKSTILLERITGD